eukprot:m.265037 g.265037  ORF g.265037 m.265037 type:complete len:462 (-) comp59589_c0_seq1:88-1473(-)
MLDFRSSWYFILLCACMLVGILFFSAPQTTRATPRTSGLKLNALKTGKNMLRANLTDNGSNSISHGHLFDSLRQTNIAEVVCAGVGVQHVNNISSANTALWAYGWSPGGLVVTPNLSNSTNHAMRFNIAELCKYASRHKYYLYFSNLSALELLIWHSQRHQMSDLQKNWLDIVKSLSDIATDSEWSDMFPPYNGSLPDQHPTFTPDHMFALPNTISPREFAASHKQEMWLRPKSNLQRFHGRLGMFSKVVIAILLMDTLPDSIAYVSAIDLDFVVVKQNTSIESIFKSVSPRCNLLTQNSNTLEVNNGWFVLRRSVTQFLHVWFDIQVATAMSRLRGVGVMFDFDQGAFNLAFLHSIAASRLQLDLFNTTSNIALSSTTGPYPSLQNMRKTLGVTCATFVDPSGVCLIGTDTPYNMKMGKQCNGTHDMEYVNEHDDALHARDWGCHGRKINCVGRVAKFGD